MIKDMVKEVRSKSNESSSRKQSMRFTESEPSRKELEEVWSEAAPGLEGGLAGAWGAGAEGDGEETEALLGL